MAFVVDFESSVSSEVLEIWTAPAYPTSPPAFLPFAVTEMLSPAMVHPLITEGRSPTRFRISISVVVPFNKPVRSFFTRSSRPLFSSIDVTAPRVARPANPPV